MTPAEPREPATEALLPLRDALAAVRRTVAHHGDRNRLIDELARATVAAAPSPESSPPAEPREPATRDLSRERTHKEPTPTGTRFWRCMPVEDARRWEAEAAAPSPESSPAPNPGETGSNLGASPESSPEPPECARERALRAQAEHEANLWRERYERLHAAARPESSRGDGPTINAARDLIDARFDLEADRGRAADTRADRVPPDAPRDTSGVQQGVSAGEGASGEVSAALAETGLRAAPSPESSPEPREALTAAARLIDDHRPVIDWPYQRFTCAACDWDEDDNEELGFTDHLIGVMLAPRPESSPEPRFTEATHRTGVRRVRGAHPESSRGDGAREARCNWGCILPRHDGPHEVPSPYDWRIAPFDGPAPTPPPPSAASGVLREANTEWLDPEKFVRATFKALHRRLVSPPPMGDQTDATIGYALLDCEATILKVLDAEKPAASEAGE